MQFANIKSAIEFKKICPYCSSNLELRSKKHVGKVMRQHVPEVVNNEIKFIAPRNPGEYETVTIDIETSKVECEFWPHFYGIYYCSLRFECMDCWQYSHTFNVSIDTTLIQISAIILNNIWIKRIIGDYEYTIKTSLELNETTFNKIKLFNLPYPPSEDNFDWINACPRDIMFPYVEIDLEDPDQTILRLDNLSLFT